VVDFSLLSLVEWGRHRKKKAKLVGWDKNSLTEQPREKKTTIILTKGIYRVQFAHHPMLSSLPSSKLPFPSHLPHINTEHDVAWHRISCLIGWFGSGQLASCEN